MAKKIETLYYYFKLRLIGGHPYQIKVEPFEINTSINRIYVEMTDEQREFYLAHHEASVMEVWNCEITPPYVPPAPDIQEYIAQKAKELKDACYGAVTITSLEYAMAEDKVNNLTADSYYNITQAREVVSNFRRQSKHAMQVFDTYKAQIEIAVSIEAVDTIYEQAIAAL